MTQTSAEKLENTRPAEKERVASMPQRESSRQVRNSLLCQKEKEQSRQSRVPDHERKRVKVGESRTLARERRIRARAWRGKGGLHREERQILTRKERTSKESLPRVSRRKHKR